MKPKQGYAISKEAGSTIDPYQNYSNSVLDQDELWSSLQSEAGRTAVGAQMAVPIRTELD
jgi:hypothetical protein